MARFIRSSTEKNYYFISIGLLLLIQAIQIYSHQTSTCFNCSDKSKDHHFIHPEVFLKNEEKSRNNEMRKVDGNKDLVTKSLNASAKTSKQVRIDERSSHNEDRWRTFSSTNKKNIPNKQSYNEFQYNSDTPSPETPTENRIVFPDDDTSLELDSRSNMDLCGNDVICENVPNYPIDIIEQQLEEKQHLMHFQTEDAIVGLSNNRFDDTEEQEPLCYTREQIMYPRGALTESDGYKYIVNTQDFVQGVRIEICVNEDSPCRLVDGFASGYKTMCEQKFIYRQLVAVMNHDEIGPQYFRIPSSCCCHVKFVGSFWERISKGHQRHSRDSSGKLEK
ncbi:hypothetical protein PV328_006129 [Microctonus aethiopoides]|uniref:Spaetzle domain-containing protein n=1 Tax=Microctonus aethiopoides TaxID=144406 RepID=A0AA39FNG6_9HYME|nr:hypothetical protein PV328_006129 [Microctonus aethiopoides]